VNYFVEGTSRMSSSRGLLLRQARRLFYHAGIEQEQKLTPRRLLRNVVLFESLSDDQIEELVLKLTHHVLGPGEALIQEGGTDTTLFIIAAGVLEITRAPNDQPRSVIGRIGPGEYIGEISLFTGDPRPATVTALTAVDAYELSREALEKLIATTPELAPSLERAVHRGLALLHRDDAARTSHTNDSSHVLLNRIRQFFASHPRSMP
jgi:CRP-like cAMP-binding protein